MATNQRIKQGPPAVVKKNKTSRKRLTQEERMQCVAAFLSYGTYAKAAEKTGFSPNTVKNCVASDEEFAAKFAQKREQEMMELFGAISLKGKKLAQFADTFFDMLTDKDAMQRAGNRDIEKLARVFGIVLDKFFLLNKQQTEESLEGDANVTINIVRKKQRAATPSNSNEAYEDDEEEDDD